MSVPYLRQLSLREDRPLDRGAFPGSLPFVPSLDLRFERAVTFFVGENGSGKSTVMEAIAQKCGLPVGGGGRNEAADLRTPQGESPLSPFLRATFAHKPHAGYFFRAEFQAHFASLLEQREADPDFGGDPYARYGGRSLHTRSHGEAFMEMFSGWLEPGIILMDEPESALSPQRQLALMLQMARLVEGHEVQFIVATHSPILLTFPGADVISFDTAALERVDPQDTAHYQITKGILEHPERYWRHLLRDAED